jgi:signal transduction histidine kinase
MSLLSGEGRRLALVRPQSLARVNQTGVRATTNNPRQRATLDNDALSADRATPSFVKGISHELHTSLNVIIGLCQLLERDRVTTLSATQLDAVERMERNAQALLHSIDHLLACLRSGHFE